MAYYLGHKHGYLDTARHLHKIKAEEQELR